MEDIISQLTDVTALSSRRSRLNRHNGQHLLPKCCQKQPERAIGLVVWDQPESLFCVREFRLTGLDNQPKSPLHTASAHRVGVSPIARRVEWKSIRVDPEDSTGLLMATQVYMTQSHEI